MMVGNKGCSVGSVTQRYSQVVMAAATRASPVHESFHSAYSDWMVRPTRDQITVIALAALEEVAASCRYGPQPQTRGLAVALAFLAHVAERSDRRWYDRFWRSLRIDCDIARPAEASAALNGIYNAVGRARDIGVISRFERSARATFQDQRAASPCPGRRLDGA